MANKPKKPRKIAYDVIARDSVVGAPMYELLDDLVLLHHKELNEARILLCWNFSWQPDVDGRCVLGKCKKASDLDRALALYDFAILLRKEFWQDSRTTTEQRVPVLAHQLMHATLTYDKNGEPVVDELGRKVYRIRKHDVEEFTDIVGRYGRLHGRHRAVLRGPSTCAAAVVRLGRVTTTTPTGPIGRRGVRCISTWAC